MWNLDVFSGTTRITEALYKRLSQTNRNMKIYKTGSVISLHELDIGLWRHYTQNTFNVREENQLEATEWFIALMICSKCFGRLYAHHQELENILVLLPHMVCNALVASNNIPHHGPNNIPHPGPNNIPHPGPNNIPHHGPNNIPQHGRIACCPAPDRRPPATEALHTISGKNTSIVSSSWW